MPEFISKVQHKTYEKGEFSDEKVRTLQETIELIKAFPYDDERALTSVELTGPSVTRRISELPKNRALF
jgi:lipase chaperone LimK